MYYKIFTLGCKVNTYESDAIRELLKREDYLECGSRIPDIVVINTCVVTGVAAKKSRQHIHKFRTAYPDAVLAVMGCFSQQEGHHLLESCDVDVVVGTSNRHRLVEYIKEYLKTRQKIVDIDGKPRTFVYEEIAPLFQPYNSRAFVKIQDGCDNFCSYCIIPYIRGRSRSRNPEHIISEVQCLVANGYREIVITGIHTGGYGRDLGDYSFSRLIGDIIQQVPNLFRLRISSLEATEIDDSFIELLGKHANIADHLHIPLQSGSQTVLKRMNRRYEIADYLSTIEKIRRVRPNIALTTDIIVGFPNESEDEFDETVALAQKINFAELHVFPFSKREGTKAASLPDQIDEATKKKRVHSLLRLSDKLNRDYRDRFIGKQLDILVEDYDESTKLYRGHSSNYIEIHLASEKDIRGQAVNVIFQESMN
ncbi:MAG: tRNA (N(6)-L-threonylcarbamoyladenosine(37)-C(2))-methylthiotransferase MtaB [Bacilli bacterium]|jgi:threonylcarbamoyladenosine tRNA methylthiotransferase MtaB